MEMNIHMAHMFHVVTQQALLPTEQRTATPELICKDLRVEFGKFETEPYIKAMKSEIEISYSKDIVELIKARKASARAQAGSSNVRIESRSVTPNPALRPSSVPVPETAPSDLALGK